MSLKSNSEVSYELNLDVPKDKEDYLRHALHLFNVDQVGKEEPFAIFAYDAAKEIIGGVIAAAEKTSVFIHILWVADQFRGKGVGSELVQQIEKEALKRHITSVTVDTYEFQAVDFYLKNGYHKIGTIEDYLEGYDRIFFRKQLSQ